MGLEVANTFEQLDETWPLLGDTMRETGAHIRQLKKVIKLMFPGDNGDGFDIPIESTEAEWNYCSGLTENIQTQIDTIKSNAVLVSGFIPYSGPFSQIPTNWQLCDGTNGTPNLTNTFIMGAATQGDIGVTGGSENKIVPLHTHAMNHNHSVTITPDGVHDHSVGFVFTGGSGAPHLYDGSSADPLLTLNTSSDGDHQHTVSIDNEIIATSTDGAVAAGANNPAYIRLAFIMRIS